MKQNSVSIYDFEVSNDHPFFLIAGPCSIEDKNHAIDHAGKIKEICDSLKIKLVYKSSLIKLIGLVLFQKEELVLRKA